MRPDNEYPEAYSAHNEYATHQLEKGAPHADDVAIARIEDEAETCCCSVFAWLRVLSILCLIGTCVYAFEVFGMFFVHGKLPVFKTVDTIGYMLLSVTLIVNVFCLHRWVVYRILAVIQVVLLMMQIAASMIAIITLIASMASTDEASSQGVAERAVYASAIALETVSTFVGALIAMFVVYLLWHGGKCQKKADGYPF